MTTAAQETGTYRPASGLKGARPWRVVYEPSADPARHVELVDARRNIVRFASYESAKRRADALNAAGVAPAMNSSPSDYGRLMPSADHAKRGRPTL